MSFLFVSFISVFVAVVNLIVDYGSFSLIDDNKHPPITNLGNGTFIFNQTVISLPNSFNYGISPNNSISRNISENFQFGNKKIPIKQNFIQYASEIGLSNLPGTAFDVVQDDSSGNTSIMVASNNYDVSYGLNALFEMALSIYGCNASFNFSFSGFPHPPMSSEMDYDSITTLYVFISFMIVSIRAYQYYFSLARDKVLFMCHLNQLSDKVLYPGMIIIGLIDQIPVVLIVSFLLSYYCPSTKGSSFIVVLLSIVLFVISFWIMVFAFGLLPKSDGMFTIYILMITIFEIATVTIFMFKQFIPVTTLKIVVFCLPNAGLHASFFLMTKIKSFYGPLSFSQINSVVIFSLKEILLYQIGNIFVGILLVTIFTLCADRFHGTAPLGWANLFNIKKWGLLFRSFQNQVVPENTPVIVFESIRKTYKGENEVVALKGVSESIKENEVILLIGPNGSGKTTLINCLTGSINVDDGEIKAYGSTIGQDFSQFYNSLGYVPQDNVLFEELTIREHLEFFGKLNGFRNGTLDYNIEQFSSKLQIDKRLESRSDGLSGGEKRKLCIAIAMMKEPRILILDEPTSGVDAQSRQIIWRTLETMKNTTAFISTHAIEEAESACSRIFVMKSGEIVFSGTPAHLRQETHCGYVMRIINGDPESVLSFIQDIIPEAHFQEKNICFPIDRRVTTLIGALQDRYDKEMDMKYTLHIENLEENLIRFVSV